MNRQLDAELSIAVARGRDVAIPQTSPVLKILPALTLPLFAATIFLASGLLFVVQPMFARMVLPRLGGSPAVWNTCVLFFQTALLLGYLYAHLSTRWLGVRRQVVLHAFVLLLPLAFLPISLGAAAPGSSDTPVVWLLARMAATVGVPFFVLSTTAPLLQRWLAALPVASARDPYFLYAGSNIGSLLALMAYPFVIEPAVGVRYQSLLWASGYLAFVCFIAACLWTVRALGREDTPEPVDATSGGSSTVSAARRLRWVLLAFVPSSLMLGVTSHITTDLAAVPLLWVLPLALYLLTFIAAFASKRLISDTFARAAALPLVLFCLASMALSAHQWWLMPVHLSAFFFCALVCHYQLAGTRPDVSHLTEFYLWLSVGGMLGGVFNTILAPQLFNSVFEYPLMLGIVPLLLPLGRPLPRLGLAASAAGAAIVLGCLVVWFEATQPPQIAMALLAVSAGISMTILLSNATLGFRCLSIVLLALISIVGARAARNVLFADRSFFGIVRVVDAEDHSYRILRHGSTIHGRQDWPADGACRPTGYYDRRGAIGQLFEASGGRFNDVALIGLGTGGLSCYAHPGQQWTFYEIDPLVDRVARDRTLFRHIENSAGAVGVVIADGRIAMERTHPAQYDLIVVDAFSSDAIPVHLLTSEAIELYMSRLKPNGILALHISNRYLRLEPVVAAIAARHTLQAIANTHSDVPEDERAQGRLASHWMTLAAPSVDLEWIAALPGWRRTGLKVGGPIWTDDYSNVFKVLTFE